MPLSNLPFVLSLDSAPYYNHDIYPNHVYRRLHPREHVPLDMHTLGLIGRLGSHAHHLAAKHDAEKGTISPHIGPNGFEVHMDVGLFQPEDLSVKVIDDCVVIEGKHEEREDEHGHISRHFIRRYRLPKGYDPEAIESMLSNDGALTVRVPKPPPQEDEKKEIIIPIQQVGPSAMFQKSTSKSIEEKTNEK